MTNTIAKIRTFDWSRYVGTEYYAPDKVPTALVNLAKLDDEQTNGDVYKVLVYHHNK